MAIRNYPCPICRKKLKLIHGLTRHMNTCTSHQVFLIHMQPKQNTAILREDENVPENIGPHQDKESTLEEQDNKEDHKNLGGESLDTGSCTSNNL